MQPRPPLPFQFKVCGVTETSNAMLVAACGADAIGLNFYERSKRFVSHYDAGFICHDLPKSVKRIGVFVNETVDEVRNTAQHVGLDYVQLHGDESVDYIKQLSGLKIIRALRVGDHLPAEGEDPQQFPEKIAGQIRQLCEQTPNIHAILLDAYDPEHFGGTGKRVDWDLAAAIDRFADIPLILAGGLNPDTVHDAVVAVRPAAVDVASGVESAPGTKDPDLVLSFIHAAKAGFAEVKNER